MAETTYSFGGFVKFDAIFSQYSEKERHGGIGDDFLIPSTIGTGDGSGGGDYVFDSHTKHSRLNFKTLTDTDAGKVKSFIEVDFNGGADERLTNQASNGLRHAFVSLTQEDGSSILTGQTWSTFFNTGVLPEAVDFVGPTSGSIFIRQPQVRYTMPMAGGKVMVAAENTTSGFYNAGAGTDDDLTNDIDTSVMPDLIARFDSKAGALSYSAAVLLRQISFSPDEQENGVAVTFSGKYAFDNGDDLKFMMSSGNLGRYIALNAYRDGGLQADGSIELNSVTGGFVAYKHNWNEKLRSTAMYAFSEADNDENIVADANKSASNINLNLMYSPTKSLTFGAEYLMANLETDSGADGDLNRVQFTSKWAF
jgi:hypothetical protein